METISRTKARALLATNDQFGRGLDRARQLALAFLIGMPYRRVEFETHEHHRAAAEPLLGRIYGYQRFSSEDARKSALKEISAWLDTPASPELVKKHEDARAAFLARKRANTERILTERAAE